MALAKKCDRCGELYIHYPDGCLNGICNAVRLCRVSNDGVVAYEKPHMDLCPKCMDTLQRYLNNEEKETAKNEN